MLCLFSHLNIRKVEFCIFYGFAAFSTGQSEEMKKNINLMLPVVKMLYEQIAWKTEGVIEVDNEIRVVPRFAQSDAVIERKIRDQDRTADGLIKSS